MANNRYYLYCPQCGENIFFAKSLGLTDKTGKFYDNALYNMKLTSEDIGEFITSHIPCHEEWEWHGGTFAEIISEYDRRLDESN